MTLFTKDDCKLCEQLKKQFDLEAMQVHIEVLDNHDAGTLAHLAWHSLVETARKKLPLLVLDDSSVVDEYPQIENHLAARAMEFGIALQTMDQSPVCEGDSCSL